MGPSTCERTAFQELCPILLVSSGNKWLAAAMEGLNVRANLVLIASSSVLSSHLYPRRWLIFKVHFMCLGTLLSSVEEIAAEDCYYFLRGTRLARV